MPRKKKSPAAPLSEAEDGEESASVIPVGPPLTNRDLRRVEKEIRDQKSRLWKLKAAEKGTPGNPGRYNPNIRSEMKLLSELYKLRWMIAKVPDPSAAISAAGGSAAGETAKEFVSGFVEAERVFRKLLEENRHSADTAK